jgi:hypothetical protein
LCQGARRVRSRSAGSHGRGPVLVGADFLRAGVEAYVRWTFSTRRLRYGHHGKRMYRVKDSNATTRGAQDGGEADGTECCGRLRHADALNFSGRATCKYLQLGDGATVGAMRLRIPSRMVREESRREQMLGSAAGVGKVKERCGRELDPRSRRESLLLQNGAWPGCSALRTLSEGASISTLRAGSRRSAVKMARK